MFAAFVACRTTLDDLSGRAAALGEDVSGAVIAAHLTGKSDVSDAKHNVMADAINARLAELSMPAAVTTDLAPPLPVQLTAHRRHGVGSAAGGAVEHGGEPGLFRSKNRSSPALTQSAADATKSGDHGAVDVGP